MKFVSLLFCVRLCGHFRFC